MILIKLEENDRKELHLNDEHLKEIQNLCRKIKNGNNRQIKLFLDEEYKECYKDSTVTFSYNYYYLNTIKNIFNKIPNSITDIIFTHSKTLLNFKTPSSFKPLKKDYMVHNLSNKLRNISNTTYGNITLDFDFLPSSLLTTEESFLGKQIEPKKKIIRFNLPNKISLIRICPHYHLDQKYKTEKFKKCPFSLKYIIL